MKVSVDESESESAMVFVFVFVSGCCSCDLVSWSVVGPLFHM